MRKFKNKFAAIAAAAMTGVMTFGLVATAAPVVSVYADTTTLTLKAEADTIAPGGTLTISIEETVADGATVKYEADVEGVTVPNDETDATKGVLTVPSTVADGTEIIVTATVTKDGEETGTGTLTITVKAEQSSEKPGDNNDKVAGIKKAEVNYWDMTLEVVTEDPYFTVDVLKTASDTEKPSKSYTYAGGGTARIDLGFLKIKKGNILNVYSSEQKKTEGKIVTIAEQPAKEKLTVEAKETSLKKALGINDEDVELYEYRSSFGSDWYELDDFDFNNAKVAGTTIVVRRAAVEDKGVPAGPEAKIKIPASAKAPKVTVDYTKDSVKVTEKMQIARLNGSPIDETDETITGWQPAKKNMTRSDIAKTVGADELKEFTIVVRTAASGKKSASMPVIVPIKAVRELKPDTETDPFSATMTIGTTTATIKAEKTDKGVIFTTSGATFQYDKGNDKWANITSGKEIKNLSGKVTVRVAPEKEKKDAADSGEFPSNSVALTPKEDKKDEGSEGGNGGGTTSTVSEITVKVGVDTTSATTVAAGEVQCSATVTADDGVAKTVTWTVKFKDAADGECASVIDSDGKLTVSADDDGKVLVITATSTVDSTKSGTAEVTVEVAG